MFIDLPPHIEQNIVIQAQNAGLSVADLISQWASQANPYPKGDIRRLKGIAKTDIKASIDEMNNAIALGAVYGEQNRY